MSQKDRVISEWLECHCDHETGLRMTESSWDGVYDRSWMIESFRKNQTSLWLRWNVPRMTKSLWKTGSHSHQRDISQNDKNILEWRYGYCDHCDRSWKWPRYSGKNKGIVTRVIGPRMTESSGIAKKSLWSVRPAPKWHNHLWNSHQDVVLCATSSRMTESVWHDQTGIGMTSHSEEHRRLFWQSHSEQMTPKSLISMTSLWMTVSFPNDQKVIVISVTGLKNDSVILKWPEGYQLRNDYVFLTHVVALVFIIVLSFMNEWVVLSILLAE